MRTFVKQMQCWIQWFIEMLEKERFTVDSINRDMLFAISPMS